MRERGYSNIKVVLLSSQVIKCLCSGLGNSCKWCGLHVSWLCFWNRLLLSERYGAFPRGKYLLLLRSLFLTGVQSGLPGPSCQQEGRSCLVKLCKGWVLLLMASPLHFINQTAHQACVSFIQVRDLVSWSRNKMGEVLEVFGVLNRPFDHLIIMGGACGGGSKAF